MRTPTEREDVQKEEVLKKCFECIVETGIEGASIKEFSNATGMSSSSLYYWFKDKDEIVIDATCYGMKLVFERLLKKLMNYADKPDQLMEGFPKVLKEHNSYLKTIFQIVSSPNYGSEIIEKSKALFEEKDEYLKEISDKFKYPYEKMQIIADLFISSIVDCVIWNKWKKLKREFEYIVSIIST